MAQPLVRRRSDPYPRQSQKLLTVLLFDKRVGILALIAIAGTMVIAFMLHISVSEQEQQITGGIQSPLLAAALRNPSARRKGTNDGSSNNSWGRDCQSYGCPIYPPELTDDRIRKQIAEVDSMYKFGKLSLPYGNANMAALTQKGTTEQHIHNQDRGVLISPYYAKGGASKHQQHDDDGHSTKDFFIAVFDGHGDEGHYISSYLQKDMAARISRKLSDPAHDGSVEAVRQSLIDAFFEADTDAPSSAMNGGSTASILLRLGNKIYFANVGDSTTFVATHERVTGTTAVAHRNRKDKPHMAEERARIESMGGKVHAPPDHPIMARVIAYNKAKGEMVGLAMSRSIGDWEHGAIGVIAEPTVEVVDINDIRAAAARDFDVQPQVEVFVVVGSDGLFDARQPQFVANHFAKSFYGKVTDAALGGRHHPIVQCSDLISIATPKNETRYRDDITLLAMKVEQ
mmetsp:Transcript_24540/g.54226  ORF Transcript_24540/g.54226 Transcript_24540/m.54226 type:complete len:457 (+) Transcript_24540:245-1615(+)